MPPALPPIADDLAVADFADLARGEAAQALEEGAGAEGVVEGEELLGGFLVQHRLHQAGRRAEARALFDRVLPVLAFSNQHLDISIHFFKRLLHAQGIYPTPNVRPPILSFYEQHARIADDGGWSSVAALRAWSALVERGTDCVVVMISSS